MRPATWCLDGHALPYLKPTQGNERDIEIPFGADVLRRTRVQRVLEVGNAMQITHPDLRERDIVCMYDKQGGPQDVHRVDVLGWDGGPYGLILSISTLEHIGYEYACADGVCDQSRAIDAVTHLTRLLAPRGRLIFTIPIGFHNELVEHVLHRAIEPSWDVSYMVRVNGYNEWQQRPLREVGMLRGPAGAYPSGWGCAGGVLFVRYRRP